MWSNILIDAEFDLHALRLAANEVNGVIRLT